MQNKIFYKCESNLEPLEIKEMFISRKNMTAFLVSALMNKVSNFFGSQSNCIQTAGCFTSLMGSIS